MPAPIETLEQVLAQAVAGLDDLPEDDWAQWHDAMYYLILLIHHRRAVSEQDRLVSVCDHRSAPSQKGCGGNDHDRRAEALIEKGQATGSRGGVARRGGKYCLRSLLKILGLRFGPLPAARAGRAGDHVRGSTRIAFRPCPDRREPGGPAVGLRVLKPGQVHGTQFPRGVTPDDDVGVLSHEGRTVPPGSGWGLKRDLDRVAGHCTQDASCSLRVADPSAGGIAATGDSPASHGAPLAQRKEQ